MSIDINGILSAVESHASASGYFDRVNTHEAKNAPGNGMTASIWFANLGPYPGGSGLAATTGRLEFTVRLYLNMLQEPQDAIDPAITAATDALLTAYSGDFELGGKVRDVDLLGASGVGLSARAGYVEIDGKMFRFVDIALPLIINDVWSQSP